MNRLKLLTITLVPSVGFISCSDSIVNEPTTYANTSNYSQEHSTLFKGRLPEKRRLEDKSFFQIWLHKIN